MAERVGFEPECAHNLLNHKALGDNEYYGASLLKGWFASQPRTQGDATEGAVTSGFWKNRLDAVSMKSGTLH